MLYSCNPPQPQQKRDIDLIVIHCSATHADTDIGVQEIDRWHRQKGWLKVGYHFVIRRNGEQETGRALHEVGAHAAPYNRNSVGICMVGGLGRNGRGENNFAPVQFKTLKTLVYQLKALYPMARIVGHRDLSPDLNGDGIIAPSEWVKECPSFEVKEWLKNVGLASTYEGPVD